MQLDAAEQMAVNQFLQDHWVEFRKTAKDFMGDDEIDALGEKLADIN